MTPRGIPTPSPAFKAADSDAEDEGSGVSVPVGKEPEIATGLKLDDVNK